MIRRALQNGLLIAILSLLAFFKAIEFADSITGRNSVEQPITYPSAAGRAAG